MASCECPEQADRDVASPGCQDVRCVALSPGLGILSHSSKEGANSDAAAAVIAEHGEPHRENVGVKGAIVLHDKEGKHLGVIDRSAK